MTLKLQSKVVAGYGDGGYGDGGYRGNGEDTKRGGAEVLGATEKAFDVYVPGAPLAFLSLVTAVARGFTLRLTPSTRRGTLKLMINPTGQFARRMYVKSCAS